MKNRVNITDAYIIFDNGNWKIISMLSNIYKANIRAMGSYNFTNKVFLVNTSSIVRQNIYLPFFIKDIKIETRRIIERVLLS